ncbi:MAG: aminoacyl-tRNA hydrolase [Proteobacteria bacterium]|nr:aminoacyl-tRNA hydrolase [Pseudomonadota bacterium]
MQLVVGLGNPGARYERTRHNVGFDVVRRLADRHGINLRDKRFKAVLGKGNVAGESTVLACPQTWMNLSGDSISPMVGWYKLAREDVVVIHDDLDLPFGVVKVKGGGGHGGHNGLRDLVKKMGGADFARVRVGVGRPDGPMDPADWVLARWTSDQSASVPAIVDAAADCVETVLTDGFKEAMNRHNGAGPVGGR